MSTTTNRGPRAYVSEFQIQVGPINTLGRLVQVIKSGSRNDTYVSVCPACAADGEAVKVKQQYVCPDHNDHGPYIQRDLTVKGKDVGDGKLGLVSRDELDAARSSELPLNVFRATVHPRSDVEQFSFDADKAYVFQPRQTDEYFALLVQMIKSEDNAFVAMCNVRNSEGFYRLMVWNNNIVLQKLLWPEDLNEFDNPDLAVDDSLREAAQAMIDRIRAPFNADEYRSSVRQRLAAINAALDAGVGPQIAAPAPDRGEKQKVDLLAALEGFGA